ncbi:MAG: hypothetical protein N2485_08745, partial [bacterium]|nr:hypothetical protein [bacterium]
QRATVFIQMTCNLLNQNGKLYGDIPVDGKFGELTWKTFLTCLKFVNTKLVFNVLNILQGCYYIELMLKNPVNEKWVGWFNRVEIIK